MSKTLMLLRHGKSSWKDDSLDDHDRPLAGRGRRTVPRMGEHLRKEGMLPTATLVSTALRARETYALLAKAASIVVEPILSADLYLTTPSIQATVIRRLDASIDSAMVVGHNPALEQLLEALTMRAETMPTAALAIVVIPVERWADLRLDGKSKLLHLWRPRELWPET